MNQITPYFIAGIVFILGLIIGYLIKNYRVENSLKKGKLSAEKIIQQAKEDARIVEIEARDSALKIVQSSETEIQRRRSDLSREEDRLQKRRDELDMRLEKFEQREIALNKRQSAVDKRANEIDKLYQTELEY